MEYLIGAAVCFVFHLLFDPFYTLNKDAGSLMGLAIGSLLWPILLIRLIYDKMAESKPDYTVVKVFKDHGYEVRRDQRAVYHHVVDQEKYSAFLSSLRERTAKKLREEGLE